ncbi:MAG: single-stranded-DNA-specific exonuclease RecJ [Chloroflexota bacterium]|nr:single-stranded-DNA-specific exonuclease RecJ [Chloroflexota bacterium]
MIEPRFRWRLPAPVARSASFAAAALEAGFSERIAGLLIARGVADPAALEAFTAPVGEGLHDPGLLPDADRLLARLHQARTTGEPVLVFGDFDADGLTGLAILVRALRAYGLDSEPYVPSRLDEGHGLSLRAVDSAQAAGRTVIVTVDTGSSSVAEVAEAARRGIDVIITDHHSLPPVLPAAIALVNPHRIDSTYPDPRLAGSGVAFKVAQLILADMPGGPERATSLAELATIGTVADVAPIIGENRAIARLGLERLRVAPLPGLAALLALAGTSASSVDLETIAFVIAPRINAAGRVGDALEAARLLLTDDPAEATDLAIRLQAANVVRRDLTRTAMAEAQAALAAEPGDAAATVVLGDWPVGVIGLVAGRLADERGRPAVVGTEAEGVIRASCRSAAGVDLAAVLAECADLFLRHGGHPGAAGFELPVERWAEFRDRFLVLVTNAAPPSSDRRPELKVDLVVSGPEVDYAFLAELRRLDPTGPGNPDPLVVVEGLTVTRVRAASGGHSQLTLRKRLDVVDGIAFGRADLAEEVHEGDRLDVVARIVTRIFGGYESIQLEIRDAAPAGHAAGLAIDLVPPEPLVAGSTR